VVTITLNIQLIVAGLIVFTYGIGAGIGIMTYINLREDG
jgi:hypothetical protein